MAVTICHRCKNDVPLLDYCLYCGVSFEPRRNYKVTAEWELYNGYLAPYTFRGTYYLDIQAPNEDRARREAEWESLQRLRRSFVPYDGYNKGYYDHHVVSMELQDLGRADGQEDIEYPWSEDVPPMDWSTNGEDRFDYWWRYPTDKGV